MKAIRLHWALHPEKAEGMYQDDDGRTRSPWYDNEIKSKQMTEAAVARELDISYELSVEGVVFKEFRDSHVLKKPVTLNPMKPVYRFIDYGRVNACVFSQMNDDGQLIFFKEIVLSASSTDAQAKTIQSYSATLGIDRFIDYGDPSGEYGDVNTATPSVQIMNEHGIYPTSRAHKMAGSRRRIARIEMTKQKLSERIGGEECIQIHHRMQTSIDAFQSGYRYDENKNGEIMDRIVEIHPYEDVIDCIAGTIFEVFTPSLGIEFNIGSKKKRDPYTGY